jgi:hypothetical protein
MIPEFLVRTARIAAVEEIVRPLRVAQRIRIARSLDSSLTAIAKFCLGSIAAPGALNQ